MQQKHGEGTWLRSPVRPVSVYYDGGEENSRLFLSIPFTNKARANDLRHSRPEWHTSSTAAGVPWTAGRFFDSAYLITAKSLRPSLGSERMFLDSSFEDSHRILEQCTERWGWKIRIWSRQQAAVQRLAAAARGNCSPSVYFSILHKSEILSSEKSLFAVLIFFSKLFLCYLFSIIIEFSFSFLEYSNSNKWMLMHFLNVTEMLRSNL